MGDADYASGGATLVTVDSVPMVLTGEQSARHICNIMPAPVFCGLCRVSVPCLNGHRSKVRNDGVKLSETPSACRWQAGHRLHGAPSIPGQQQRQLLFERAGQQPAVQARIALILSTAFIPHDACMLPSMQNCDSTGVAYLQGNKGKGSLCMHLHASRVSLAGRAAHALCTVEACMWVQTRAW